MRRLYFFCLLLSVCLLPACAAMQTSTEYSTLDVKAATERPVFLRYGARKVMLNFECPVTELADLPQQVKGALVNRGYQLVASEAEADLILDVRVRNQALTKHSARAVQGRNDPTTGAGAALGVGAGYVVSGGDPVSTVVGGASGLVVGGLADVTINSWVHLGVLDIEAHVLAREKIPDSGRKAAPVAYKETETRVTVRAKQAGLKWEDAAPLIQSALLQEFTGLLPANT